MAVDLLGLTKGLTANKPVTAPVTTPVEVVEAVPMPASDAKYVSAIVPSISNEVVAKLLGEPMVTGQVERRLQCLKAPLGADGHWLCSTLPCGDRLAELLPAQIAIMPAGSSGSVKPVVIDFEALLDAMVEAVRGEGGPHKQPKVAELLGVPCWALAYIFARFPILNDAHGEILSALGCDVMTTAVQAALGGGKVRLKRTMTKREPKATKDDKGNVVKVMTPVSEVEEVLEKELPPDPTLIKMLLTQHPDMKAIGADKEREKAPPVQIVIHEAFKGT